jgi:hypothetical protein
VFIETYNPVSHYTYSLYDLTGNEVSYGILMKESVIDLMNRVIIPGFYILKISDGTEIIVSKKIVKTD